jgi:hypothetical protein
VTSVPKEVVASVGVEVDGTGVGVDDGKVETLTSAVVVAVVEMIRVVDTLGVGVVVG